MSSETAFLEDYVLGTGDTLEMPCDLKDHAEPVVWFKDGAALVSSNRTRVGQRMLRIINVSYEDSGVYSCRLAHSNTLLSNRTVRVTGESNEGGISNLKMGNRLHVGPVVEIIKWFRRNSFSFCVNSPILLYSLEVLATFTTSAIFQI